MKTILRSIKNVLATAGEHLRNARQILRRKAVALWHQARLKMAQTTLTVKNGGRRFWKQVRRPLLWLGIWLLFGTLATAGLFYLYRTNVQARTWLNDTAAAILALLRMPVRWRGDRRPVPATPVAVTTAQTTPLSSAVHPIPGLPQPNNTRMPQPQK